MLKAISHIALVVRDTARTAQMFEQVFGARAIRLGHERKGPPETFLPIGGVWFVLVKGEPRVRPRALRHTPQRQPPNAP